MGPERRARNGHIFSPQICFWSQKRGQKWTLFWSPKLAPFWPTYEPHTKILIGGANRPILGAKNRSHFGTQIWPPNSSLFLAQSGHRLAPKSIFFGSKLTLPVVFLKGSSLRDKRWLFVCNDQLATCSAIEKLAGHKPSITDIINITTFV